MLATLSSRRTGLPSLPIMLGIAIIFFGGIGALSWFGDTASPPQSAPSVPTELSGVLQYADVVAPATRTAGRAIVLGIRPDIADFKAGRISEEVWQSDMTARLRDFSHARAHFAALRSPSALPGVREQFLEAFDLYLLAAGALLHAAAIRDPDQTAVISLAASVGDAGDERFGRAAARLQEVRSAHGLEPDLRFPRRWAVS